jgi:hypothetical protein
VTIFSSVHIEGVKNCQKNIFSVGEEKLVAPLIATPNVDNANRRQRKAKS